MESSASSCVLRVGACARKPESLTSSTVSPMDNTCHMPAWGLNRVQTTWLLLAKQQQIGKAGSLVDSQ